MHKAELEIVDALVTAIETLAYVEDAKIEIERKAREAGAILFAVGLIDSVRTCPPEPIHCTPSVLDLIRGAPQEIWVDMILSVCADTNMIMVGRSDIMSIIGKINAEDRAGLFGTVEAVEHELHHQDNFNKGLEKARNEGTHW